MLALVGESGSGKSTAGRFLQAKEAPADGNVFLECSEITSLQESELRRLRPRMQMFYQELLDPRHKVGESIKKPLWIHEITPKNGTG